MAKKESNEKDTSKDENCRICAVPEWSINTIATAVAFNFFFPLSLLNIFRWMYHYVPHNQFAFVNEYFAFRCENITEIILKYGIVFSKWNKDYYHCEWSWRKQEKKTTNKNKKPSEKCYILNGR